MNEKLSAFLSKVVEDEALQAKFEELDNFDDAYELASSIQDGFSKEEFVKAMEAIRDAADDDISDEDLAAIAGGEGEAAQVPAGYEIPTSGDAISQGVTGQIGGAVSEVSEASVTVVADTVNDIAQSKIGEATADLITGVENLSKQTYKSTKRIAKSAAI